MKVFKFNTAHQSLSGFNGVRVLRVYRWSQARMRLITITQIRIRAREVVSFEAIRNEGEPRNYGCGKKAADLDKPALNLPRTKKRRPANGGTLTEHIRRAVPWRLRGCAAYPMSEVAFVAVAEHHHVGRRVHHPFPPIKFVRKKTLRPT